MSASTSGLAELELAYRNTHYGVQAVPEFVLRVDRPSAPLRALYTRMGVDCAAYMTAWNPHSEIQPEANNQRAQQRLVMELARRGYTWLRGRAVDPLGHWPSEDSALILGLSRRSAQRLGMAYRQNAILWAGQDAMPRLLWLPVADEGAGEKKPPT